MVREPGSTRRRHLTATSALIGSALLTFASFGGCASAATVPPPGQEVFFDVSDSAATDAATG